MRESVRRPSNKSRRSAEYDVSRIAAVLEYRRKDWQLTGARGSPSVQSFPP